MKRDEILSMPAGRAMDALVSERVMGWAVTEDRLAGVPDRYGLAAYQPVAYYSTDIAAAWHVVERVRVPTGEFYLEWTKNNAVQPDKWLALFGDLEDDIAAFADTAPLAICRAALLAVMGVES